MSLLSYFNYRAILQINQVKGSETPSAGVPLSPLFLLNIGGMPGETKIKGAGAPPVAALGIIGQVASRLLEIKS